MKKLERARKFERATEPRSAIPTDPWRPSFHVTPPRGWMNDPNGFCLYRGKIHLFFQYNPFAEKWGPMYWGHCASDDFVSWERLPAALAPDRWYDGLMGCFSGTALPIPGPVGAENEDELVLMYTGVSLAGRQQQCVARSGDGIDFRKDGANPVIPTRLLPPHAWKGAFRDPKLFFRNGAYYCLVGARDRRTKTGMILLYRSDDLRAWSYASEAYACPSTDMIECPDLAELDGRGLLIFSPTNHPPRDDGFRNRHASVYSIGELDLASGVFTGDDYRELDGGFDFYAPQTLAHPDGRVILVAWMQMWKRAMPTAERGLGWAGAMTFPRELTIRDGALLQAPARELARYRRNPVARGPFTLEGEISLDGVSGDRLDLLVEADVGAASAFELRLFAGREHRTVLRFDLGAGLVTLDRGRSGQSIRELRGGKGPSDSRSRRYAAPGGRLRVRVLLDRSSVEVFLGEGELAMTAVVYPGAGDDGIEFASEGKTTVLSVRKWDIEAAPPAFR